MSHQPSSDKAAQKRYIENIQSEIDSAALYRVMATVEKNPDLAQIYVRLAEVEEAHIAFWSKKLHAIGGEMPDLRPHFRTQLLGWLAKRFGPAFVLPSINALEKAGSGQYNSQPEAVAGGLPQAERSHARIIEAMGASPQTMNSGMLAQMEGRHHALDGNTLRAAVLGANDGLVSNLSLIMGVAGAAMTPHSIIVTGLAGLLAGACSMALGEWLSVNSSREAYQRQIAAEAEELEQAPEEEKEELALIYQSKGLPPAHAKALAEHLISNQETALDTLAREELGIDPQELGGSAWMAAASSFALFAFGAIFPVAPFLFLTGTAAVIGSIVSSGLALFLIGAGTTLFTGRGAVFSGIRQLLVGLAAAAITYGLGHVIGVTLG